MTKKRPKHWWWQVILANKTISLAGEQTSMDGLFDLSNEKGGEFTQVTLNTKAAPELSVNRNGMLRETSYNILYFKTRDGWEFPVPRDAFIQRSKTTTKARR